jgi:ubiquinone/menaquinone biosynthesis C-methylase UbiE
MAKEPERAAASFTADAASANPAVGYEHFMVPPLFAPAAERLIAAVTPRRGDRVLDVGTGTGIVARRIASRVAPDGAVFGLDLNPAMLAVARDTAAQEQVAVVWQEGRAETLPYPDEQFDLVVSQFALMFMADSRAALREMARVLTPGGRIGLSVFQGIERHPFYLELDQAIIRHLGTSPVRDIFALGDSENLAAMLMDAGFRDVSVAPFTIIARFPHPESFLAGEIDVDTAAIPAMQSLDATARQQLTAAIQHEMAAPLRLVTDGDHVRLPFHAQIALGGR